MRELIFWFTSGAQYSRVLFLVLLKTHLGPLIQSLPLDYPPFAIGERCLLRGSHRAGGLKTFEGLWLDETSYTGSKCKNFMAKN